MSQARSNLIRLPGRPEDADDRRLTPREIEERQFVREAIAQYHIADYRREERRRFWKGLAWAFFLVGMAALAIAWTLR